MLGKTNGLLGKIPENIDFIPKMTSNTMGEWEILGSSLYEYGDQSDTYYKAFNKDTSGSTDWHGATGATGVTEGWIQVHNTQKKMIISSITFYARSGWDNRLPKVFHLQGSNDGTNFVTIQSFDGPATSGKEFFVSEYNKKYSYIRIKIDSLNGGNCINIGEIILKGHL